MVTPADKLEALLPCPFCGEQPEGPQNLTGSVWLVKCASRLRHDAHAMSWVSAEDAITAWNTRAAERAELGEAVPRAWLDGAPNKPWSEEWFIAETEWGRVVLKALPDEYSYDFKTADETYIKREKIKRWMQFPDSDYTTPPASVLVEALRELVEKWRERQLFAQYVAPDYDETKKCADELTAIIEAQEKP